MSRLKRKRKTFRQTERDIAREERGETKRVEGQRERGEKQRQTQKDRQRDRELERWTDVKKNTHIDLRNRLKTVCTNREERKTDRQRKN